MKIDFVLSGTSVQPQEISKLTGVVPDVQLLRGERNKELVLPRQNLWSIQSRIESDEVSDHWNEIGPALIAAKTVFRDVARTGVARIVVVIQNSERLPSLQIPPSMAEFAGFVNAIIDIDHLQ